MTEGLPGGRSCTFSNFRQNHPSNVRSILQDIKSSSHTHTLKRRAYRPMNGEQDGAVVHLVCSADQAKSAILNAQIVLAAPRTTVLMGDCILELVFAFLPQFECGA